jgi:hypothetical protein
MEELKIDCQVGHPALILREKASKRDLVNRTLSVVNDLRKFQSTASLKSFLVTFSDIYWGSQEPISAEAT